MAAEPSSHSHRKRRGTSSTNSRYTTHSKWATSDDFSPLSVDGSNVLEKAIVEMKLCKGLFDKWAAGLDEISSSRPSEYEIRIREAINSLREDSTQALSVTSTLVNSHKEFSRVMARCLQMNAESNHYTVKLQSSVLHLAEELRARSEILTLHILSMRERLNGLVNILEKIDRDSRGGQSFWEVLTKWLQRIFDVLSKVFMTAAAGLGGGWIGLIMAFATYSLTGSQEDFDAVLTALRKDFPLDVARIRMGVFESCHNLFQREMEMQKGKVKMTSDEAMAASVAWQARTAELELIPLPDLD